MWHKLVYAKKKICQADVKGNDKILKITKCTQEINHIICVQSHSTTDKKERKKRKKGKNQMIIKKSVVYMIHLYW